MFVDARWYQIFTLSCFLLCGKLFNMLDIDLSKILVSLCSAISAQFIASKALGLKRVEYKSAVISATSLALLLRSNDLFPYVLAAGLSIFSKFLLRVRGKHVFNPTNFGLGILLASGMPVWISPGQWGSYALGSLLILCLGGMVAHRALRSDLAIGFLIFYSCFLLYRAYYLGDPLEIPMHQLQNGALLLFSFFMISDPKTTPDSRVARIIFALLVAYVAFYIRFTWYEPNALIYSLLICSPSVLLLDFCFKAQPFYWTHSQKGDH